MGQIERAELNGREVIIRRPRRPTAPAVLVLALHGAGMDGQLMQRVARGLAGEADKRGWWLAYPSSTTPVDRSDPVAAAILDSGLEFGKKGGGKGGGFGIGGGTAWNLDHPEVEADFFEAIAAQVGARTVFVTGVSQGGAMIYRLLALGRPQFRAACPVAAYELDRLDYTPRGQVPPILHIHGTNDGVVRPGGGSGMQPLRVVGEFWRRYTDWQLRMVEGASHFQWPADYSRWAFEHFDRHREG